MSAALTIVTVAIDKHVEYIERQIWLARRLNPGVEISFLIFDNGRAGRLDFLDNGGSVRVVQGPELDPAIGQDMRGSYHHASALNIGAGMVTDRYVLFLDPDCFPIYRNWVTEIVEHMTIKDVAVFGVPWHPRWYRKYRGFPCVHFMFVDRQKIGSAELDFKPALAQDHAREARAPYPFLQKVAPLFYARVLLETRRDTGWRMYAQLSRAPGVKSAITFPVLDLPSQLNKPKHLKTPQGRRKERLFPARWSFLPPEDRFLPPEEAPWFSSPALKPLQAETFVWRGAPFAFHLRRNVRDSRGVGPGAEEDGLLASIWAGIEKSDVWLDWR